MRKPDRRFLLPLLLGPLAAAVALLVFWFIAENMILGASRKFDEAMRESVHSFATPALTTFMQIITQFGDTPFLLLSGLAAVIVFWQVKQRRKAAMMLWAVLGGEIIIDALKNTFHRPRPDPYFFTPLPESYSFPSGHAMLSFCFYGMLALLCAREVKQPWRGAIWVAAVFMIATIGLSRVYLSVHWTTDVFAGFLGGFIWLSAVILANRLWKPRAK